MRTDADSTPRSPAQAGLPSWSGGRCGRPCVVKNTFLHVLDAGDEDFVDATPSQSLRSESEPARPRLGWTSSALPEPPPCDPEEELAKELEVDSMNEVNLSVVGMRFASGESGSTTASSTQPAAAGASGKKLCPPADGSLLSPSVETLPDYATDASTVEYSPNESSDQDGDSVKQMRSMDRASWSDGITTVMIRQVPRCYTQRMLLDEVNSRGFEGLADFIYLPFDVKKNVNVGYGFLSFVDSKSAQAFRDTFDGMFLDNLEALMAKVGGKNKGKPPQPLRVHPATVQGYEANLRHFVSTRSRQHQDPMMGPLFLPHGIAARPQPRGLGALQTAAAVSAAAGWVTIDEAEKLQEEAETEQDFLGLADRQGDFFPRLCDDNGNSSYLAPPQPDLQMEPPTVTSFCHACGTAHCASHNFCTNCGTRLVREVPQQQRRNDSNASRGVIST